MALHVAVGVIEDDRGRVLIARRSHQQHQGNLWEFPGGKVEPGETVGDALARELFEEVGIKVVSSKPLITIPYDYGDKSVFLDVWLVNQCLGQPHGKEGQPITWVNRSDLSQYSFPLANIAIVNCLLLPDKMLITPELTVGDENNWLDVLERSLAAGVRLVQYRQPGVALSQRKAHIQQVHAVCHRYGAKLVLNGDPDLVVELNLDGVHLPSHVLERYDDRPLDENFLVGASCHNPQEVARAAELSVDYGFLSPVLRTQSHPELAGIGWDLFEQWVKLAPFPVYALGGMTDVMQSSAQCRGGQGIAAIRGLWRSI